MAKANLCILGVNTSDIGGGAENVGRNLFNAFRLAGHEAWLAVGSKRSNDPNILLIPNHKISNIRFWLAEFKRLVDRHLGREDFNFPGTKYLLRLGRQFPDIIQCNNLHGEYFDLGLLPWLCKQVPMVLRIADEWLLTGHCGFSLNCNKWQTGCGNCPDLARYPGIRRDSTAYNLQRKQKIYSQCQLYVVTASQWLMQRIKNSILRPAIMEARVIPNGVDLSIFRPGNRQKLRSELNIPQESKVILFTASKIKQHIYKDYATLHTALSLLSQRWKEKNLLFIALGEDASNEQLGSIQMRFIPYQSDPCVVAKYYQAADLYAHAAQTETWGLSITESLACAMPVVATATGGIPEQLKSLDGEIKQTHWQTYDRNEATGILVRPQDAEALACGIQRLLSDDILRQQLGRNGLRCAIERFDIKIQAQEYLQWFQEILDRRTQNKNIIK